MHILKYLTHTVNDMICIHYWKRKSSQISELIEALICVLEKLPNSKQWLHRIIDGITNLDESMTNILVSTAWWWHFTDIVDPLYAGTSANFNQI